MRFPTLRKRSEMGSSDMSQNQNGIAIRFSKRNSRQNGFLLNRLPGTGIRGSGIVVVPDSQHSPQILGSVLDVVGGVDFGGLDGGLHQVARERRRVLWRSWLIFYRDWLKNGP